MYEDVFEYANTSFTTEADFLEYLEEALIYGHEHAIHIPIESKDYMMSFLDGIKMNLLERKEVTKEELDELNIQLSVFLFDPSQVRKFLLHPGVLSFDSPFEVHKMREYCHQIYQYPKSSKLISHDGHDPTPVLHVIEGTACQNKMTRATLTILTKDNMREYYFIPIVA